MQATPGVNLFTEGESSLAAKNTVDDALQIRQEAKRWHHILERLVYAIQYLAERNLPFHGSNEEIGSPDNGCFLGVIEIMGKFDPVIQDHLQKIKNEEIQDRYVGKSIQDELINLMGEAVLQEVISRVKAAKYFAIIMGCNPAINYEEHLSMVIRYVSDGIQSNVPAGVHEHFIKFLEVDSSTGENLCSVLLHELETLGLDIENVRGQRYDDGVNMKGYALGVQAQLIEKNPRAFFTPCACRNYNLVLGDVARTCVGALAFFGTLRHIYILFASSAERWAILRKHVKGLSAKPPSETRWECRMESVNIVRCQVGEVCDALEEFAESIHEPSANSKAVSLLIQITEYKFLVFLVFWHAILRQVNAVSKQLRSSTVDVATGPSPFQELCNWLKTYRENGFNEALNAATEIAKDLSVEPEFKTQIQHKKRTSDSVSAGEPLPDPETAFRVQCFNQVVDKALQTFEPRFEQMTKNQNLFGFLCNFQDLPKDVIRKCAADLEVALTDGRLTLEEEQVTISKRADIDGYMLCEEIEALKPMLPEEIQTPMQILEFLACNDRCTAFPNLFIALRIFLTIPETVSSGERGFSKMKQIKTYLRSSVYEEHLNSLAILSIESEISRSLDLDKILKGLAAEKARQTAFS